MSDDGQSASGGWREWEVPFDADDDYPEALKTALAAYRAAWRGKMDEVNAVIAASAVQEDLVDHPKIERGILRVSGPFTVEGMVPLEISFDAAAANNAQRFTVFGLPRVTLSTMPGGEFQITMEGVDIYDPVQSVILPTRAEKVAAWFLDSDYDGRHFCTTQAFFPDKSAWEKLAKALKGVVDEARFAALSGTVSLPFPAGENRRAAVKVIDPRGNEVMKIVSLPADQNEEARRA